MSRNFAEYFSYLKFKVINFSATRNRSTFEVNQCESELYPRVIKCISA